MDYWRECISEAFEDAGIAASEAQIETVVSWVEGDHENYGMAHGHDCIPNPLSTEIDNLKKVGFVKKWDLVHCKECNGRGRIIIDVGFRSSSSQCWKCGGSGRHFS